MSYIHNNTCPVQLSNDPIDPNSTDWIFFSYESWLRSDETITLHTSVIVGGTAITASAYLGTVVDEEGTSYTNTYGVQVTPTAGATQLSVTHRVTTSTSGIVDIGRTNIDHTAVLQVKSL